MKSQLLQWRFPTSRPGALLASLALVALGPGALAAQGGAPAPTFDAACRCLVADSTAARDGRDHGWAFLGAAGLAVLAGLPIAGAATPAIPFVAGTPAPPAPFGDLAGLPPAGAMPGAPAAGEQALAPVGERAVAMGPLADLPASPRAFLPPKTATHLPLLAAAGVVLLAAGGLLARREARRQRRRRRRIATI